MRLVMPDGTAIIVAPVPDGVVVGTQGVPQPDGTLPPPSGLKVTGDDAEILGSLIEVIEDAEIESILGSEA